MSPLDMEIVSLLREINEKPKDKEELIVSINKIDLEKHHDSLSRISRIIPFNVIQYIENLSEQGVKGIINLL